MARRRGMGHVESTPRCQQSIADSTRVMSEHKHTFGDVDLDREVVIVNGERFTERDAEALAGQLSGRENPL